MASRGRARRMKAAVVAAALGAVCSCRQPVLRPLDVAALGRSGPRTVSAVSAKTPPFMTSAGGQMVAMSPMISSIVNERSRGAVDVGMEGFDPANIGRPLVLAGLVQRFGLRRVDQAEADVIIDLRTVQWGLTANRDNNYWLDYVGTLRVIDGRTGAVLAEGTCTSPAPRSDADQPPSLLAWGLDGAGLLRRELWKTADRCAADYLTRVLKLR
jgi:hypothetical protein